jgi:hypothetical protein
MQAQVYPLLKGSIGHNLYFVIVILVTILCCVSYLKCMIRDVHVGESQYYISIVLNRWCSGMHDLTIFVFLTNEG